MQTTAFYKRSEKAQYPDLTPPELHISLPLFTQLRRYVNAFNHEIMLLGTAVMKDRIITITEWLVPPQTENSGAYVTTDDDHYPAWLMAMSNDKRRQIRVHLHTHPGMSTTPSATDQTTLYEHLENLDDFYVRIITNAADSYHVDIFDIANHLAYTECPIYVDGYTLYYNKTEKVTVMPSNVATDIDKTTLRTQFYTKKTYTPPKDSGHHYDSDDYYGKDYGAHTPWSSKNANPHVAKKNFADVPNGSYIVVPFFKKALDDEKAISFTFPDQQVAYIDSYGREKILKLLKILNEDNKDPDTVYVMLFKSGTTYNNYSLYKGEAYDRSISITVKKG